jgi:hypothetical protein
MIQVRSRQLCIVTPERYGLDSVAVTDMSVSDLHALYINELAGAGWMSAAKGDEGSLSWSVWSIPGRSEL